RTYREGREGHRVRRQTTDDRGQQKNINRRRTRPPRLARMAGRRRQTKTIRIPWKHSALRSASRES
ncbi:MAG: hypothetical protein LJE88_16180, partial [Deltaproteobacteria bacterium]|nr:hypothetical protein [Deltaproteobacteria bacterium]